MLVLALAMGHSWVELVGGLDLNETMVGDSGFIRGAMSRPDPAFNDLKQQHMYLLPPPGSDASLGILPSDPSRDSQQTA